MLETAQRGELNYWLACACCMLTFYIDHLSGLQNWSVIAQLHWGVVAYGVRPHSVASPLPVAKARGNHCSCLVAVMNWFGCQPNRAVSQHCASSTNRGRAVARCDGCSRETTEGSGSGTCSRDKETVVALVLSADCIDGSPKRGDKLELIATAEILTSCAGRLRAQPLWEFVLGTSKRDQNWFNWKSRPVIDQVRMPKHTNFIFHVDRPIHEPSQNKSQVIIGIDV